MSFYHVLSTLVFALIVALLFWVVRGGGIRRSIGGARTDIDVIVTSGGSPSELEQSVKGLICLMNNHTLDPKTVIVIRNAGGNFETAQMARILARDYAAVKLES